MAFATAPSVKSFSCSSLPELAGQVAVRLDLPVFRAWLAVPAPAEKNLPISIVFSVTRKMACAIFQMCPYLLAAGVWGHFYIDCFSDTANFGSPCVGPPVNWTFDGGTSLSSPIMAGIQSMINQATGERQGNPNFVYYALAASGHSAHREASCDATLGNHTDPDCVFYDVTLGDIDVNCLPLTSSAGVTIGTFNCYIPSGTNGVLSLSNSSYEPTYRATTGWDFATGIGSVNAFNLARNWPRSRLH